MVIQLRRRGRLMAKSGLPRLQRRAAFPSYLVERMSARVRADAFCVRYPGRFPQTPDQLVHLVTSDPTSRVVHQKSGLVGGGVLVAFLDPRVDDRADMRRDRTHPSFRAFRLHCDGTNPVTMPET